jgi:hypothetical protein
METLRQFLELSGKPQDGTNDEMVSRVSMIMNKRFSVVASKMPILGDDCLPIDFKSPVTHFRWTNIQDEVSST